MFNQVKWIYEKMGDLKILMKIFHEKFYEYFRNALAKNIESGNFMDKIVDFFIFFVTY